MKASLLLRRGLEDWLFRMRRGDGRRRGRLGRVHWRAPNARDEVLRWGRWLQPNKAQAERMDANGVVRLAESRFLFVKKRELRCDSSSDNEASVYRRQGRRLVRTLRRLCRVMEHVAAADTGKWRLWSLLRSTESA